MASHAGLGMQRFSTFRCRQIAVVGVNATFNRGSPGMTQPWHVAKPAKPRQTVQRADQHGSRAG
jgi:hypothetical protein